jgi:hypothetical protein
MLKRTIRWAMPIIMLLAIATFMLLSHVSATFAAGSTTHATKQHVAVTATATPIDLGGIMTPNMYGSH